ncbi:MAG: hypothetical protein QMB52_14055 [Propionivibrio sp.]
MKKPIEREIAPIDTTVRFDRAEEVRRRWVSIAAYYVAQRQDFEQRAELELDDLREVERGFSPAGND